MNYQIIMFFIFLPYCYVMFRISWTIGEVWGAPLLEFMEESAQLMAMRLGSCYVRSPGAGGCDTRLHYVRFSVYNSRDFYFNTARPMPAPAVVLPYGDEEVRNRALRCTSQAQFVPSIKNAEYEITVESVVATLDIMYGIFGERPKLAVSTSLQPLRIGINAPFPFIV